MATTAFDIDQPPPVMNLEDLFDMQLFDPSSQLLSSDGAPSASRHSPNSPDYLSYSPSTPPQLNPDGLLPHHHSVDPNIDPMLFYEILAKDFSHPSTTLGADAPATAAATSTSDSPSFTFGAGTASGSLPSPMTAFSPQDFSQNIDPSLVAVPTPQHHDSDSDDDHEEPVIQPIKVGGKGKARKGTVASGGVVKRTAGTSAAAKDKAADDDWRPSPEEYKKMSSKEKRQLRNKISARNFRVRRKEYITTLEGDVADRDNLIEAIREELSSTRLENVALRQEVEALKRAMMDGRASPDALPPPAPLPPTPPAVSPALAKRPSTRASTLSKPNTQKDLPTSPRINGTRPGFWGGSSAPFAGGIASVHATLIPEFKLPSPPSSISSPNSSSSSDSSPSSPEPFDSPSEMEQENINPALNLPCFGGVGTTPNPKFSLSPFQQTSLGSNFDAFAETNPFTLKTLDAYRMQLWGRMAREAGRRHAQQHQQQHPTSLPLSSSQSASQNTGSAMPFAFSPLTSALRPAFFTGQASPREPKLYHSSASSNSSSSHGSSLAALFSGKSFSALGASASSSSLPLPTPPTSPTPSHASLGSTASSSTTPQPTQAQALVAGLATQTLLSKLGSAFWDAFSARSSSSASASAANGAPSLSTVTATAWDHEKVKRVLEGKAVVKVVDVETELEKGLKGLSIGEKESQSGQGGAGTGTGLVGGWRKYAGAVGGGGSERK